MQESCAEFPKPQPYANKMRALPNFRKLPD
jgi:hypothetical protein